MADFPDYSYLSGRDFKLPEIDIYEPLKQRLTLRQLADAQEYNRARMRHMQLQEQQQQREYEDQQQYRQGLLNLPASADLATTVRLLGPKGIPYYKAQQEAIEQGRKATEAGTKATEAETARKKALSQQIADIGIEAAKIPLVENLPEGQIQPREDFFNTRIAGAMIDRGYAPANEFGGYRVPQNDEQALFDYASAYGVDKKNELLAKRAEAALNQKLNPLKVAEQQARTAITQQELTGQKKPSPAATPALFEQWLPGYLESNNLEDTAKNRSQAVEQYHRILGLSQGMTPGAVQQQIDLAAARARVEADAAKNKPMSAEASKVLSVANSLVPELTKLRSAIQTGGREAIIGMVTGSNPVLARIYENAADLKGRLRSGGAMNKDETANFKNSFGRPSDVVWGTDGALAAIESAISEAENVEGYMKPDRKPPKQPSGNTSKPVIRWGKDANGNPVRLP